MKQEEKEESLLSEVPADFGEGFDRVFEIVIGCVRAGGGNVIKRDVQVNPFFFFQIVSTVYISVHISLCYDAVTREVKSRARLAFGLLSIVSVVL